jgi:hypothetical protein
MFQRSRVVTLALVTWILSACVVPISPPPHTPVESGVPAAEPTETQPTEAAEPVASSDACPSPTSGYVIFTNAEHGYCVAYPETHEVIQPNSHETVFVIGSLLNAGDPRLHITITPSGGRTAAEAADAFLESFGEALSQFNIERSETTLGGEPAAVLDVLPGQEINRRVFAVHGNLLYDLMFMPADESLGAPFESMEQFYANVLESFTFLPEATTSLALDVNGVPPVLIWQGYTEFGDGDATTCKSLLVTAEDSAAFGPCGEPGPAVDLGETHAAALNEFRNRLMPFIYFADDGELDFVGSGTEVSYAWQRAAANWALYTYAELASGRASASARTALSWFLGEAPDHPGLCRHLVVLNYGYAYARLDPCEGSGEGELIAEGWLETPELEQFDTWLYANAPVFEGMNTFDARGKQPMSEADLEALASWADATFMRLTQ